MGGMNWDAQRRAIQEQQTLIVSIIDKFSEELLLFGTTSELPSVEISDFPRNKLLDHVTLISQGGPAKMTISGRAMRNDSTGRFRSFYPEIRLAKDGVALELHLGLNLVGLLMGSLGEARGLKDYLKYGSEADNRCNEIRGCVTLIHKHRGPIHGLKELGYEFPKQIDSFFENLSGALINLSILYEKFKERERNQILEELASTRKAENEALKEMLDRLVRPTRHVK
jgi:hypothetical protein